MLASQIQSLRERIAGMEGASSTTKVDVAISSGLPAVDHLLPSGGLRRGTLVEWLSGGEGAGATTLALLAAREACRQDGVLVVVDRSREFYPPAAARLGIELARLILVHAQRQADHDWALDQALRCPAVAAVLAWPEAMRGRLDGRTFRRLQLAAEEGGSLGLFVRPESVRGQPSWADVRFWVEPLPAEASESSVRRWKISVLRCRGGIEGRNVEVESDEQADFVSESGKSGQWSWVSGQ